MHFSLCLHFIWFFFAHSIFVVWSLVHCCCLLIIHSAHSVSVWANASRITDSIRNLHIFHWKYFVKHLCVNETSWKNVCAFKQCNYRYKLSTSTAIWTIAIGKFFTTMDIEHWALVILDTVNNSRCVTLNPNSNVSFMCNMWRLNFLFSRISWKLSLVTCDIISRFHFWFRSVSK